MLFTCRNDGRSIDIGTVDGFQVMSFCEFCIHSLVLPLADCIVNDFTMHSGKRERCDTSVVCESSKSMWFNRVRVLC